MAPEQEPTPKGRTVYIVAVYHVDMAYGGREEGGWWYDRGSLVRIVKTTRSLEAARTYCRRLNDRLKSHDFGPNAGKREKSSVLSDGVYEAHLYEDQAPTGFPERKPHYE